MNMKRSTGLATEEMMPCPTCDTPTFEIGDCFACSSKKGDAAGPWTQNEISEMTAFARGYISASMQNPDLWLDTWEQFADGIDIHLKVRDADVSSPDRDEIEAWGYRRDKVKLGDCDDEVRLI